MKERIIQIRLLDKIISNPKYAKQIGIYVKKENLNTVKNQDSLQKDENQI